MPKEDFDVVVEREASKFDQGGLEAKLLLGFGLGQSINLGRRQWDASDPKVGFDCDWDSPLRCAIRVCQSRLQGSLRSRMCSLP